jgi:DNA helicase II / ATP-dependent DNA helicase PcrA
LSNPSDSSSEQHEHPLLKGLNPQQIEAVSAPPGPVLVIAGPGSGKTAVLTRRVAYLIDVVGLSPYKIMAVTFTNKAAKEMQTRIERLLGGSTLRLPIGTFHSICARILRKEAEYLGIKSSYVIYDTSDQLEIMKRAIEAANLDADKTQPRKQLNRISGAKNELITPEEYPADTHNDKVTKELYGRYQTLMRQSNALDFDDLLMQTVMLFRRNPEVLREYQNRYDYILIDEFQDTNTAQYELVKMLTGSKRNVFCVGDPDQSIYRFRGADYRNVGNFQRDYPDTKVILLEQNYRSHQKILDAAMAIIDKNPNRIVKHLTTPRQEGSKITVRNLPTDTDEAIFITQTAMELKYGGQYDYRDIAVMYRTNAQSRSLEEAFVQSSIPYRLIGGTRFYERREIKDLMAYLKVVNNPDDSVSLERIINVPARGIGKTTLVKLQAWANQQGASLYNALLMLRNGADAPVTGKAAQALIDFTDQLIRWQELRESRPAVAVLSDILDRTKYRFVLNDGTDEGRERIENVESFYGRAMEAGNVSVNDFLEQTTLVSDIDSYDESANGVVLLTLHAAKGLEFPVVFIVGMEEGVLPHTMALENEDEMDEERRLMYVGITRAKDRLYLTWANRRAMYGSGSRTMVSRFMTELPEKLVTGSPIPRIGLNRDRENLWDSPQTRWTPPPPPTRMQPTGSMGRTPRPESRPSPLSQPKSRYKTGQKVLHSRYGEGVIIASKIRADDEEVDVKFPQHGMKRFFASTAHLVLLDDE